MSQAPVQASDYEGAEKVFAEATAELNRQVDEGTSWSGHERNQVYLNLGRPQGDASVPQFADFSAVSGFDVPDDSRALTTLDWDFDGDLDVVMTNRTAPRVRIFENRLPTRVGSSLSLKMVGTEVNRDGIGSRIALTLELGNGEHVHLERTLHAGHGFLSQSSKWLHFGIPEGAKIVASRVHWQGREPETFEGIEAGTFQILKQGEGRANPWPAPSLPIPPARPAAPSPEDSDQGSTVIAHLERPVPLPTIPCLDFSGARQEVSAALPRPLLINLWATWCAPCVAELQEFSEHAEEFRDAGVSVLALCIDVSPGDAEGTARAEAILDKAGFPFIRGLPSEKTVELLHIVHNTVFLRPSQLPVPTSLLLAPGAKLATVIRGATSIEELRPALRAVGEGPEAWETLSRPGDGPWVHGPDTVMYSGIAKELIERGWLKEAEQFLLKQVSALKGEGRKYAELLMLTGTRLLEAGEVARGTVLLQAAVDCFPKLPAARNNLAVALLRAGRGEEAAVHLRAASELDPAYLEPQVNLARFHLSKGNHPEALALVGKVLQRGYHGDALRLKAQVFVAENRIAELQTVFEEIVKNEPKDPSAWTNLGKLQLQLGQRTAALRSFESARRLLPDNVELQAIVDDLRQQLAPTKD